MPPAQHAILSASSAARWIACPPSARINAERPGETTVYAEEGTLAHALGELKLRKLFGDGVHPHMAPSTYKRKLGEIKKNALYSEEMDYCTDEYVQHVQDWVLRYDEPPMMAFEQKVDFSGYVPHGFGTADCIMLAQGDLHVFDYKHGKGVPVEATDNPQLKLYAIGAYLRYLPFYTIQQCVLHICQPRAGGCHQWSIPVQDLIRWAADVVKPAAEQAWEGKGEFRPGPHCRFCAIRATCRARAQIAQQVAALPRYGEPPAELTNEEIGAALTLGSDVADWLEKLKAYAAAAIEDGEAIDGYKLVAGRTTRSWDNQAAAFDDLRAAGLEDAFLYERTPLSVAKLERLLGKKKFSELAGEHVVTSPGKPTLVPNSDPRPTWSRAATDFANI